MGSNVSVISLRYSFFEHFARYLHFSHSFALYLFLMPFLVIELSFLVSFIPAGHRYASSFGRYLKLYFLNLCFLAFLSSNLISFFSLCYAFLRIASVLFGIMSFVGVLCTLCSVLMCQYP